jgi:hypothetical protein
LAEEGGVSGWRRISTAPRDGTHVLLLTSDFGAVEGWWNANIPNFYKSQEGWASYDPENAQGDWVSEWSVGEPPDKHHRLFCGETPVAWKPLEAISREGVERLRDRMFAEGPA